MLIDRNEQDWNYSGGFENIDVSKHLISFDGDSEIVVHIGHIIKFFDTITFSLGSYKGRGLQNSIKTDGIGFSTKGIFSLIGDLSENKTFTYVANHIIIEYFDSNLEIWENTNTNFDGLSIHFRGFEY